MKALTALGFMPNEDKAAGDAVSVSDMYSASSWLMLLPRASDCADTCSAAIVRDIALYMLMPYQAAARKQPAKRARTMSMR